MKRTSPTTIFLLCGTFILLAGLASTAIAALALLALVVPATVWLGSLMVRQSVTGVRAVARVLIVLALMTLAFAQVYLLIPSDSFSPSLERSWSGVAESLYLSTITAATLGGGTHSAATALGKLAQTVQVIFSLVALGFGLNYVIDTHLK